MKVYWEYVCEDEPSNWFVSSNPDLASTDTRSGGRMVRTHTINASDEERAHSIALVWREVQEGLHDTQCLVRPHRPISVWEDGEGDIVVHYDAFEGGGIPWETKVA